MKNLIWKMQKKHLEFHEYISRFLLTVVQETMESESTIYTYQGGMQDYAINFDSLLREQGETIQPRNFGDDYNCMQLEGKFDALEGLVFSGDLVE